MILYSSIGDTNIFEERNVTTCRVSGGAITTSVMLEIPNEAVWCNSPEDCGLNFPFCENHKISFGIVITAVNLNS
jgi:hypothetical protein